MDISSVVSEFEASIQRLLTFAKYLGEVDRLHKGMASSATPYPTATSCPISSALSMPPTRALLLGGGVAASHLGEGIAIAGLKASHQDSSSALGNTLDPSRSYAAVVQDAATGVQEGSTSQRTIPQGLQRGPDIHNH